MPLTLTAGDIAIVGFNTTNPDSVRFISLVDITAGTTFNVTDNGWQSNGSFTTTEGILTYTAPSNISAGTVLTWTNGSNSNSPGFNSNSPFGFAFNISGDSVTIYTGTLASPTLIYALNSGTIGWSPNAINSTTSAEPTAANNGTLITGNSTVAILNSNGYYNGVTTSGTKDQLLSAISNPANWTASTSITNLSNWQSSFTVNPGTQPDLTISLSDSPNPVTVGNNLTYTITVNNNGNANASGIDVDFTLPAGLSVVGIPGVSNNFNYAGTTGGVAKFTGGSINAGGNAILTLQVIPNNAGNLTSGSAIVDSNNSITESNESNNNAAAITTTVSGLTKINEIQGNGATSPLNNTVKTIEGIVVGDFQTPTATGGLGGFFLQEETADEDGNPLTSEGIFVFADSSLVDVSEGQKVRVTGTISETFGQTQITPANAAAIHLQTGGSLAQITPATVNLPFISNTFAEQFEGMRVTLPQTLTVSDTFELVRFGEITLSNGRLFQPTNIVNPGTAANLQETANNLNKIIIDDGRNGSYQTPFTYGFNASNPIRTGQTTTNIEGVLSYDFNNYRIHPTTTPTFTGNPRTNAPETVGGDIKVASFNLLNYFNGSTFPTSRGASTSAEFTRQRDKTIDAILKINSDIIGVMELENDGYTSDSAIQDLVNGLNSSPNRPVGVNYAFINPGVSQLGGDEITVGLIYNSAKVSPVGNAAILTTGAFDQGANRLHRPPLAQTFQDIANGGKFTTVVNHFKSKGSAPLAGDPNADQGDGQGAWNLARTQAANQLTAWLATDPTNSGDSDFIIVGDLNSYAKEDPITAIINNNYTNLIENFVGQNGYSYVFQGQAGYLDHALSSSSLTSQVTGATEWHINADENPLIDYNEENLPNSGPAKPANFYNADRYRSSDHDPIVLGINLAVPNISIQAIDANASEAGSDGGIFRISRSGGGSIGALNVTYTVSGQATSNDYNPSLTGTATIAAGQSFVDVTITTVDDSVAEGNESLTLNLVDAADYNLDASNSATVNIADNDIAGVTISQSNTNVTEGGVTDNYTVVLTTQPTAPVTVNVTPSNNQINLGAGAGNPISLNFTPNTWNSPQTVTVTAIDDSQIEGNHSSSISHSATSSDSNYNLNLPNVAVNITDNDTAALNLNLTINPNSFSEGAGANAATATITRTGSNTSQLIVNLASSDTTEATVLNSVIIPVGQSSANFAVSAVEDIINDGSQTATITASAASFTNASANVIVTDNDTSGIIISKSNTNVTEGGATDNYTVVLTTQPTAPVTVNVTPSNNQINLGAGAGNPISLDFTPNTWNSPQTVTVTAIDDSQIEGNHSSIISHSASSSDSNYNLNLPNVAVNITDNDTANVTNLPPNTNVTGGGSNNNSPGGLNSQQTTPDPVNVTNNNNQIDLGVVGNIALDNCCNCDRIETLVDNSYKGEITNSNSPHDLIFGDANFNIFVGGIGNDTIFARSGDDLIFGNQDRDVINGNEGNDTIFAGKDDDFVRGGQNDDLILGDLGNDTVCGDLGNDTVFGILGDDILIGNKGDDILNGNEGKDTVCGGEGNDLVRGGKDDDLVSGGSGNDTVYGDIGNDTICGCEGNDLLIGGEGGDIFVLAAGRGSDVITDFVVGKDLLRLTSNLSFRNLTITQGSGNQIQNTLIFVTATNELLVSLIGVSASAIDVSAIALS